MQGNSKGKKVRGWLDNFLAHRPLLFQVVGKIVKNDEIEDILQETFVHSYTASRQQTVRNPKAFMVRIATNIALNHINRSEYKLNCSLEDIVNQETLPVSENVENQCQSDERFMGFCRAAAQLPTTCRKVFVLKKVYGMTQKEIARFLGISPSTVENHVTKGLKLTAKYMQENGYDIGSKYRGLGDRLRDKVKIVEKCN